MVNIACSGRCNCTAVSHLLSQLFLHESAKFCPESSAGSFTSLYNCVKLVLVISTAPPSTTVQLCPLSKEYSNWKFFAPVFEERSEAENVKFSYFSALISEMVQYLLLPSYSPPGFLTNIRYKLLL